MTPNFLVIGAPKCGTTSLYYYLRQHPDVYLPVQKELHYFSFANLRENANGPGDEQILSSLCASSDEYNKHYAAVGSEQSIGDISPSYLYYGVQENIRRELGAVKIVVMLRNPIDKAYSQYMHLVRDQRETLPFYEALLAEESRIEQRWSDIWRYAESSLYADRLQAYMDCFGYENVHVIIFDEFINDSQSVMVSLFEFLNIDKDVPIDTEKTYNRTGKARSIVVANFLNRPNLIKSFVKTITPDAWRIALRLKIMDSNTAEKKEIDSRSLEYLREYFKQDTEQLEQLIGKSLVWTGK
ncbi:sulfotransferase family protein [Thiohalomonas denitrificans]|uniref:Sulfotransferase family protein n=1 Tax=Thiohalomonas denitrificans TaxID=415747 RepID=A0A1G5R1F2_9GAMM|nr:sulfotransferase [Thiohalomonas denitrificans]SCZ67291.1 Sulfotransferase family protein [Thiohalomonas denitrificans]